jgi:hypothetical protein
MALGEDLRLDAPLSSAARDAVPWLVERLAGWSARLRPVSVEAPLAAADAGPARSGAATFFSGGIDSSYTLLTHQRDLDALVFVHGYDLRLDQGRLRAAAVANARSVAAETGKVLVELETDCRRLLDPFIDWGEYGHRLMLMAIGLLLAPQCARVYVPAGYADPTLGAARTRPEDYEAFGFGVDLTPDGLDTRRIDKTITIAGWPLAMANLRVCWENRRGALNCGVCEKCLRTLVGLRLAGIAGKPPTFARPLDLDRVRKLDLVDANGRAYMVENLELAQKTADVAVEDALGECLDRSHTIGEQWRSRLHLARRVATSEHPLRLALDIARAKLRRW